MARLVVASARHRLVAGAPLAGRAGALVARPNLADYPGMQS